MRELLPDKIRLEGRFLVAEKFGKGGWVSWTDLGAVTGVTAGEQIKLLPMGLLLSGKAVDDFGGLPKLVNAWKQTRP